MAAIWKILPSRGEDGEATAGSPPRLPRIASRIAKAFSKPKEARPTCEQCGPLLSLPFELLEQILNMFESKKDLCSLRGTCSQLNEFLEPRIFEELVIDSAVRGSYKTGGLIKALASDKAPCLTYTTTLRINSMVIFSSSTQANWKDPNMDFRLKPLQDHHIAPAFKALRNIKRLHWNLKLNDPYMTMVDGLSTVPSLEELYITFDHWTSASVLPLDKFSNLTVLAIEDGDWGNVCGTIMTLLGKVIQSSPRLVDFRLGIMSLEDTTLDDIFAEASTMPALKPQLQHIRALDEYWVSFKQSWGVLSHLTSMNIPNLYAPVTLDVWNALANQSIQLLSLTVSTLSPAMVHYLTSFVGLQKLHIENPSYLVDAGDLPSQLFNTVLPHHRMSLSTFVLKRGIVASGHRQLNWCPKPADLESLLQCKCLEQLSLPFRYHTPGGPPQPAEKLTVEVRELLHSLAQLPNLRQLCLSPILVYPHSIREVVFGRRSVSCILEEVQTMEISDPTLFRYDLQLLSGYFRVMRRDVDGRRCYFYTNLNPPLNPNKGGCVDGIPC